MLGNILESNEKHAIVQQINDFLWNLNNFLFQILSLALFTNIQPNQMIKIVSDRETFGCPANIFIIKFGCPVAKIEFFEVVLPKSRNVIFFSI